MVARFCRHVDGLEQFKMETMKVLVAGHTGMVGSSVVRRLQDSRNITCITPAERVDFRDATATQSLVARTQPSAIVICAGKVGGIGDNIKHPAEYVANNAAIQLNIIQAAHAYNVPKLIALGSSCIYPRLCPQPMLEEHFLTGPYEPTNRPYAVAKTLGIELCRAYWQEYLRNYYALMPPNLYGPNDNFRPHQSHVVAALIRKVKLANRGEDLVVWGSGNPRREFMHVDDLASAIEFCLLKVNAWDCGGDGFINVGTGEERSIRELAGEVIRVSGKQLKVVFDKSKPDGMPTKRMDASRLRAHGWSSRIQLAEGLASTWQWVEEQWDLPTTRK